jgi:PAP2 superfamily
MNPGITHIRRTVAIAALLLSCGRPVHADVVLDWNAIAVRTLTTQTPPVNPFEQARLAAIIQLAVFDAVNAITGEYQPYLGSATAPTRGPLTAPLGASPDAAAIAAAHAVLVQLFPGSTATLNVARDASLAAIPDGAAKSNGIATGLAAATAIIAERNGDGSSPVTLSLPPSPPSAGMWEMIPGCPMNPGGNYIGGLFANWGDIRPFGVVQPASGHWVDAFRPDPPPALSSHQYTKAYDEVKRLGAASTTERPVDRTTVAQFYAVSSPTFIFHSVATQLAAARGDSLTANARSLALVSIATNDSLIASFWTKYYYYFWRPYSAIRGSIDDGNRDTVADPGFVPLIVTPCFPGYPSNHASGSNGAAETLRRLYGAAGHNITLSNTILGLGAVNFSYTSLKQIVDDIDDARIYGGIHFRFDQDAGARLGREVATAVYKNNLRPIH